MPTIPATIRAHNQAATVLLLLRAVGLPLIAWIQPPMPRSYRLEVGDIAAEPNKTW